MASHSSGGRNGRRSRGGPRRRSGGNRSYQNAPTRAPEKKSFMQWLKDLFSGGGKPAPKPARQEFSRSNGAEERSERSERPERQERPERESRPSRKPEAVEVTTPRLYVGNLSFEASESDLFELFNGVGAVQNA
jgi:hypothetical protein